MEYNERYIELLIENSEYSRKIRTDIHSDNYKKLQRELLDIELKMSSKEIIKHHEHTFPTVGMPS